MKRSSESVPVRTEGRTESTPTLHGTFGIGSIFDDMERMMEETFGRSLRRAGITPTLLRGAADLVPPVDMYEESGNLVVRTELAGLKREDLDVSLSGNHLTISGVKKHEEKEERKGFLRRESSWGSFSRTVALPEGVDIEKLDASFNDGVLEIRMPVKAEGGVRRIDVH